MAITRGNAAFTLVELAIVLVIMGLVGTLFYSTIAGMIGKEKDDQAETILEAAREELTGYAVKTGTLPEYDPGADELLPSRFSQNKDPWGGGIHYVLAEELKGEQLLLGQNATSLRVEIYDDADAFNTGSSPERSVANVAYVVASDGPNRHFQASIIQESSPDKTRVKILRPGIRLDTGLNFDDIVSFVALNELKAKVSAVR